MVEFAILLKPRAIKDLDRFRRYDAAMIADGIEKFLTHDPVKEGKSRIKRLRGIRDPDYRLRLGEFRVFYNVDHVKGRVHVLRVLHKTQTREYYEEVTK